MTPVLFIAHGAPMLAYGGEKAEILKQWGAQLERPKAILIFSAHWQTDELIIGKTSAPKVFNDTTLTINLDYETPDASDLVSKIKDLLSTKYGGIQQDINRGWDHGVWTVLMHLFPNAEIPVLQLSLPRWDYSTLISLGETFGTLRKEGVMLIGSGQLTHDLTGHISYEDASAFDEWLANKIDKSDLTAIADVKKQTTLFNLAHPTDEHFTPLLIKLGAAVANSGFNKVTYPIDGFEMDTLSKRSIQWE